MELSLMNVVSATHRAGQNTSRVLSVKVKKRYLVIGARRTHRTNFQYTGKRQMSLWYPRANSLYKRKIRPTNTEILSVNIKTPILVTKPEVLTGSLGLSGGLFLSVIVKVQS